MVCVNIYKDISGYKPEFCLTRVPINSFTFLIFFFFLHSSRARRTTNYIRYDLDVDKLCEQAKILYDACIKLKKRQSDIVDKSEKERSIGTYKSKKLPKFKTKYDKNLNDLNVALTAISSVSVV